MRRIVFFILLCTAGISAFAQIQFKASAPNVVEIGERFRLIYSLNSEGTNFKAPVLSDFQILSGPNPSSSSSISIVNGKMEQSYELSYTYILQPNSEGKFTVPAATIVVDNKTYQSNSLQIEVVKGSGKSQSQSQNQNNQSQNNDNNQSESVSSDDLYIKINFNKSNPYVGEPITATFKFYSKVTIYNITDATMPKYSGFYSKDLNPDTQIQTQTENINGQKFVTGIVQKVLLIPQKSGEITIDPASLEFVLIKNVRPTHFFDDGRRQYSARVSSKPVTIKVKPLPANSPADFNGAVGKFTMNVKADKTDVKANEAITITTTISGVGNLKLVNKPTLNFPPDFDIYDPKETENLKNSENGISGSKTFEYLIIPRHEGTFNIPPVSLSYFDLSTNSYKTLKSDNITFNIAKGDGEEKVNIIQGYSKSDIQYLGKDIKFISTGDLNIQTQYYLIGTNEYILYISIPSIILLLIIILRYKQIKENANISKVKNKKANKVSQKRLKLANTYLKAGKGAEYYEELMKTLWGYLSDKLTIPVAELTKDTVTEKLRKQNIDEANITTFLDILNQCEFARYAPSADATAKEHLFEQAKEIITLFENKLK